MNAVALGRKIAARRAEVGLTQADLAARMFTTQSAVSRIEAGRSLPSLPFLERFAKATGRPFELRLGDQPQVPSAEERRRRVRRVLGSYRFDPWQRQPSEAEARTLIADGLTRERFQSESAAAAGLISVDDLYLDRLRQATIDERGRGVEFQSALAVVAACDELIDWSYVRHRLNTIRLREGPIGDTMRRLDSRIRSRVRRRLSEPESHA